MPCPHCHEDHPTRGYFCPQNGFPVALPPQADGRPVLDGKYQLIRTVGEGAMGMVYVARHLRLGKHFALKLLRPDLMSSAEMTLRFEQEARAASAIGHPHIVEVTDLGQSPEGFLFLVMEMLTGHTLAEALEEGGRLGMARAVDITCQILDGLEAAHGHRVVHRDLKPENVFLCSRFDREDFVKVLDFGIARCFDDPKAMRLTQTGLVMGTPHYMAPEQARGLEADHRVDVYAAGVMLYEMITGEQPFVGSNYNAVMMEVIKGDCPLPRELAPEIPGALEAAIIRAMAADPKRRYQSALEFRTALEALVEEVPVETEAPAGAPVGARQRRAADDVDEGAWTAAVPSVASGAVAWEFPAADALEVQPLDAPPQSGRVVPPLLPDLGPPRSGPARAPAGAPLLPDLGDAPVPAPLPVEPSAEVPAAPVIEEAAPELQVDDRPSGPWKSGSTKQVGMRGPAAAGVWEPPVSSRVHWRRHLGWVIAVIVVAALVRPAVGLYAWLFDGPAGAAVTDGGAPVPTIPVVLEVTPADADVRLDGVQVRTRNPLVVPRDGRTHTLRFSAPGREPREVVFEASEPQRVTLELVREGQGRRR
jgi:serine/threonine-protein kinase